MITNCSQLTLSFPSEAQSGTKIAMGMALIIASFVLVIIPNLSNFLSSHGAYLYSAAALCAILGVAFLCIHKKDNKTSSTAAASTPIALSPPAVLPTAVSIPTARPAALSTTIPRKERVESKSNRTTYEKPHLYYHSDDIVGEEPDQQCHFRALFNQCGPHIIFEPTNSPESETGEIIDACKAAFRKKYPHLTRCVCPKAPSQFRTALMHKVRAEVIENIRRDETVVIATIGPGGFFEEMCYIREMISWGYRKFQIIAFEKNPAELTDTLHPDKTHVTHRLVNLEVIVPQFLSFMKTYYSEATIEIIVPTLELNDSREAHIRLSQSFPILQTFIPHILLMIDIDLPIDPIDKSKSLLDFCKERIKKFLPPSCIIGFTQCLPIPYRIVPDFVVISAKKLYNLCNKIDF